MNVVEEIKRINETEAKNNVPYEKSWHYEYRHSNYVFIANIHFSLTEGDIMCIFSQFGEVIDCYLVRDAAGKSKGFGFIAYEDPKSCVLAVDGFNGAKIKGLTIRVDHSKNYQLAKAKEQSPSEIWHKYLLRRKKIFDWEAFYKHENIMKTKTQKENEIEEKKEVIRGKIIDTVLEKRKDEMYQKVKDEEDAEEKAKTQAREYYESVVATRDAAKGPVNIKRKVDDMEETDKKPVKKYTLFKRLKEKHKEKKNEMINIQNLLKIYYI